MCGIESPQIEKNISKGRFEKKKLPEHFIVWKSRP